MQFDPTNDYVSRANYDSALRDNATTAAYQTLLTSPLAKLRKDEPIEDVLTNS